MKLRRLLHSKIHRATATHVELHYEGSCAIDATLLEAADIAPYEAIEIYNVTNGERFGTYAIVAEANSGIISVNGAAAHKANVGDILIIAAYTQLTPEEIPHHEPKLVYVNGQNKIERLGHQIPVQMS